MYDSQVFYAGILLFPMSMPKLMFIFVLCHHLVRGFNVRKVLFGLCISDEIISPCICVSKLSLIKLLTD